MCVRGDRHRPAWYRLLGILTGGFRQGHCALPRHSVDLERAECFPLQMWLFMEGAVVQVGLGLGTCGSAQLHVQEVVHPSYDLLAGAHHLQRAAVVHVVAGFVVLADGKVQGTPHTLLLHAGVHGAAH